VPITNPTVHQQVLDEILLQNLLDESNSWMLRSDGAYERVLDSTGPPVGRLPHNAHTYFITHESLSGRGAGGIQHSKPTRSREQDI
jgi:polyphosphate kinase